MFRHYMNVLLSQEGAGPMWLVKHVYFYWKIWEAFNPYYVKLVRDHGKIRRSIRHSRFMNGKKVGKYIYNQLQEADKIPGKTIDMDRFMDGDRTQLMDAMQWCGVGYDPSIVDECVEPELWTSR